MSPSQQELDNPVALSEWDGTCCPIHLEWGMTEGQHGYYCSVCQKWYTTTQISMELHSKFMIKKQEELNQMLKELYKNTSDSAREHIRAMHEKLKKLHEVSGKYLEFVLRAQRRNRW